MADKIKITIFIAITVAVLAMGLVGHFQSNMEQKASTTSIGINL